MYLQAPSNTLASLTSNGIAIGSAVFAWFSVVSDRQTDTPAGGQITRYLRAYIDICIATTDISASNACDAD